LSLILPVSRAIRLFSLNFEVLTHVSSTNARALSVSLPFELGGHVDLASPSTDFVEPNPLLTPLTNVNLQKRDFAASRNTSVDLYGFPTAPAAHPNIGYIGKFAPSADLSAGPSLLRSDIPSNTTFSLLIADNGMAQNPSVADAEAGFDIQYAMGTSS
ncbi:hypothetical protein B0H11DRAFT_1623389, partial [Mycena galericulata]